MKKVSRKMVGGALMVAAIASVFLIDWNPEVEEPPPPIRPLKTLVVGTMDAGVKWQYPGKVSASEEAEMAFEVAGTVQDLLVNEGDRVTAGMVLARLDPSDYTNAVKSAQAELQRSEAQLSRVKQAAKSNAVSQQEVSDAQASYDKADAEFSIRQKALADTEIKAQFDGVIARTYVKQFENVRAKAPILNLQNIQRVEIQASIPEARVALVDPEKRKAGNSDIRFTAAFDFFKDRTFELEVKEFSTEADPVTQTYSATFVMEAPKDVTILPGMTAMVSEEGAPDQAPAADGALLVPLDMVPVDGLGQYFVWVLEQGDGEVHAVTRRDVSVGEITGDSIAVASGLSKGDRIAAAGVHILVEGQQVRLLESGS